MQQSLPTRKTVTATKDIDYAIDAKPCMVSLMDPLRISVFLRAMFVVSNELFLRRKVFHNAPKT